MKNKREGLCFRCEHRADSLERNTRSPRYECGDPESNKFACYCYKPVKPVAMKPLDNDPRPRFAGIFSSREQISKIQDDFVADTHVENKKDVTIYWRPKSMLLLTKDGKVVPGSNYDYKNTFPLPEGINGYYIDVTFKELIGKNKTQAKKIIKDIWRVHETTGTEEISK